MRYMKRMDAHDNRTRIQRYRDTMRARGMRPLQIWVPDTRTDAFRREASRQCLAANAGDDREDSVAWLESVSVFDDTTEG